MEFWSKFAWRQGCGEGDPNRIHTFHAFLSFSQQRDTTLGSLGGTDPFGSFQGAFPVGEVKGAAPQLSPVPTSIGPAFDAYFHLNRLMRMKRGIYRWTSSMMNVSPRDNVDLKGVCMVPCDPEHYPSAEDLRRIRQHPDSG